MQSWENMHWFALLFAILASLLSQPRELFFAGVGITLHLARLYKLKIEVISLEIIDIAKAFGLGD